MKKHILTLIQENGDYEKVAYNKLKDNIVKLVTDSSPDYHSNATLPTYFNASGKNGKGKGVGVLMKEFFSGGGRLVDFVKFTEAAKRENGTTKWQLLRSRVQTAHSVNTTNAKLASRTTGSLTNKDKSTTVALVTGNTAKRTRSSGTELSADDSANDPDNSKKPKPAAHTITDYMSPAPADKVADTNQ